MSVIYRWNPGQVVLRKDDDDGDVIDSMVVPFDEWIEVDSVFEGNFVERFAQGSLRKTLRENMSRIRVYFEHGFSKIYDSQPIAELLRAWEEPQGAWFSAALLEGLPDVLLSGLSRGLYGASIGASIKKADVNTDPEPSEHNPKGLEERTYTEVQAHDFSITPRPAYASTSVAMRAITDELAVERLVQDPDRLLKLLREHQEPEPTHSEPPPQEDPDDGKASRATQVEEEPATVPSRDYLAPTEEEPEWRLP